MTSLVRPALAMVAALTLLSGCSGDSKPQVAVAAKTRASPSATATNATAADTAKPYSPPTRTPGVVPIRPPNKTTAGIFVLVWFETLDYGYASGNADPLRQTTALGCFTCANWIIEVQSQADKHLERTGGYVHVRQLVFVEAAQGEYVFCAVLDRDPGVLAAPDGKLAPVTQSSGEQVELRVGLTKSAITNKTSWTMNSVTTPAG